MQNVIRHIEGLSAKLDDALREMQGPAVWNDLANRAERNATEYRDDNGKCKGNSFWNDGTCQNCAEVWVDHVCTRCGLVPRSRTSYCAGCSAKAYE